MAVRLTRLAVLFVVTSLALAVAPAAVSAGSIAVVTRTDATLTEIDTDTQAVVGTFTLPSIPTRAAVSPDGALVYIGSYVSQVSALDLVTNVMSTITLADREPAPAGTAFSPNSSTAYVTDGRLRMS